MNAVTDVVMTSKVRDHDRSTGYEINRPNRSDGLLTQQHEHHGGPKVPRPQPGIEGERRTHDVDQSAKLEEPRLVPSAG